MAEDFIQRRMDTTGQLCAVLDLPVAAAELCRNVAALAAEHGVTMAFSGDAVRSRVTLRARRRMLAALQALSVYFPENPAGFQVEVPAGFYYAVGKEVQTMDLKNWYDRVREQLDEAGLPGPVGGLCILPVCPVQHDTAVLNGEVMPRPAGISTATYQRV